MTTASRIEPSPKPVRPITGRTVLYWMLGFFAVIFAANAAFIYFALSSFPGLEVASSYRAGLEFKDEVNAAAEQSARGWQVAAAADRSGDGAAVRATFADSAGSPERALAVTARFEHPTDRRHDRSVRLVETDAGVYEGVAEAVAAGRWVLVLEAEHEGARLFRSRNDLMLP